MSFVYGGASGGNVNNLASITDSLGRVTTISYGQTDTAPDIITFKGSNGTPRTIEVGRNLMGNLLRTGQTLKSTQELFPGLVPDVNNNDIRNPRRVAYVKLPDGRQYNFKYSSYSDIARIEFPTGGAVEYDWDGWTPVPRIERWVTERREYPNGETGTNYQLKTKYEYFHTDPDLNGRPFGNTKVTQFASTANGDSTLVVSKHYFIRDFSLVGDMFSFNDGTFGTEYQTEIYNTDGTTLINKVFNEKVSSSLSETKYTAFDLLGKVLSSQQITDGQTYNSSYVYNLSGAMLEETYPSGRVVKNTFDNDSDLQQVQSRKANDTFRNYANSFNYTAAGAVDSMCLGKGKWENTQFNSRLQPIQIGLCSGATSQNLLKLNYD